MNSELSDFIRASFGSVWTLEVLLVLMKAPERAWSRRELVEHLRSSEAIVVEATHRLAASGLANRQADGVTHYAPCSPDLDRLAKTLQAEYARAPIAVRRTIVSARSADPASTAADVSPD
jgi:hypothetical protein